jgi:peptidoglycan hydrolase-like protein with peptidoglycan-binding domain
MKKIIAAFFTLLAPAIASAATFNTDLSYGMKNNSDVTSLQQFLAAQGDYTGPITGNFYSLTLQGVKNFQARNHISPVSGYFGPLSRGVANGTVAVKTNTSSIVLPTPENSTPEELVAGILGIVNQQVIPTVVATNAVAKNAGAIATGGSATDIATGITQAITQQIMQQALSQSGKTAVVLKYNSFSIVRNAQGTGFIVLVDTNAPLVQAKIQAFEPDGSNERMDWVFSAIPSKPTASDTGRYYYEIPVSIPAKYGNTANNAIFITNGDGQRIYRYFVLPPI